MSRELIKQIAALAPQSVYGLVDELGQECTVVKAAEQGEPQRCYNNSAIRAIVNDEGYMEGFTFVHGVPIQHAWNRAKDGTFVDMTLRDPEHRCYVGVRVPNDVVRKVVTNKRFEIGDGVLGSIQLFPQKARDAMMRKVRAANNGGQK